MQYFAIMKFTKNFNILIGIERENIIFSHYFKKIEEQENLVNIEKKYYPTLKEDKNKLEQIFFKLNCYKRGENINPSEFKIKFSRGTKFEKKVWETLRNTKKGDVVSYKNLSNLAGYPNAQRAVGNAMSKNYLLLFIPCHRVVKNNKDLGGFSCGIKNKEILLNIEKKRCN